MGSLKNVFILTGCFYVITAFHTPQNDYSSTDIPSNDESITLGTLSTSQRFKILLNKVKYLIDNNIAVPSAVSSSSSSSTFSSLPSSSSLLSSSSFHSSSTASSSSIVSFTSINTVSTLPEKNILLSTIRTLQSPSSTRLTCNDLGSSSSSSGNVPVCGQHGVCIDFTSSITGLTSPRCRCDDGWVGYSCNINTQNVKEHCYNDIYEPLLGETDIDCGGSDCSPCHEGLQCIRSTDCLSTGNNNNNPGDTSPSPSNGLFKAMDTTYTSLLLSSSSSSSNNGLNRTVLCAADTRICTANITKPSSLYFYTTLRFGGLSVQSIQNSIVSKAIQNTLLRIFLNDPEGSYINDHPEVYTAVSIRRIRSYTTTNQQQRRLRSFTVRTNAYISSTIGWRLLTQETGVEIDIEYQVNNVTTNFNTSTITTNSSSSSTELQNSLSNSIDNGQLIQYITNQVPTVPVTRVTYEPSSTNILQIADRPAPNPIENENTSNDSNGATFSSIGGTIAIICTVFVLIPMAGLSVMAFLGERDANGHTWVDRSLIVYCPCCARSLVKNPVTASAPRGIFSKRKPRSSVIVQNPALELAGQKIIQITEEKKSGIRTGKEFLAEKKAERDALAARRPRSSSKSKMNQPVKNNVSSPTSPSGVKRIGGSQPHGVLIDTVKPTVANVVEIMKDTATLGIEIGTAYEQGAKLPSPQYNAPNTRSTRTPTNSNGFSNTTNNGNNNTSSNSNNPSTGATTVRLAFAPSDDDNTDDISMVGGLGRQTAAKMHRPSIVSSSQRVAFTPDVSRRDYDEDLKPVPSTPLGPHNGGRSNTIIVVPPSPISSTPLLNGTQGTPVRAVSTSYANSSTPLPPPIPSAVYVGGGGSSIRNNPLSYGTHSSTSSLNSSINGDSNPASVSEQGYLPPPDLRNSYNN